MGFLDGLIGQLSQASGNETGQGSLAGLAQSLLGGADGSASATLLPAVLGWVQQQGGVGNVVSSLQSSGLGAQAQSWVSNEANQELDPQHINALLGSDQVAAIAAKAGLTPEEVQSGVAAILPHVINHLTPNGDASDTDQSDALLSSALGKLSSFL